MNDPTTKDISAEVMAELDALAFTEVLVGVPDSDPARKIEDGETPSNARIGYINEYGSPAMNIPPRPHLVPGVASVQDFTVKMLGGAIKYACELNPAGVEANMMRAGITAQNAVRRRIVVGPFKPLAEETIRRRRARKPPRMGTKPLNDTGQYRNAITFVLRYEGDDK